MTVKINLKAAREKHQMSQNELARQMDLTVQSIQYYEQGRAKSISLEILDKFCAVLGCQVQDILIRVPD